MSATRKWGDLPERIRGTLRAGGVRTGRQLERMTTAELVALPGIGPQTMKHIRAVFPLGEATLETPAHGVGQLRRGNPGNKGGRSYPSRIRRELTQAFGERIDFIADVVDGKAGSMVVSYTCGGCGMDGRLEVAGAKVADRLRAWELLGKFGPGSGHTFTKDEVADLMTELARETQARLREVLGREEADQFVRELLPGWKGLLAGFRS